VAKSLRAVSTFSMPGTLSSPSIAVKNGSANCL
jgi:hypothetical protein